MYTETVIALLNAEWLAQNAPDAAHVTTWEELTQIGTTPATLTWEQVSDRYIAVHLARDVPERDDMEQAAYKRLVASLTNDHTTDPGVKGVPDRGHAYDESSGFEQMADGAKDVHWDAATGQVVKDEPLTLADLSDANSPEWKVSSTLLPKAPAKPKRGRPPVRTDQVARILKRSPRKSFTVKELQSKLGLNHIQLFQPMEKLVRRGQVTKTQVPRAEGSKRVTNLYRWAE